MLAEYKRTTGVTLSGVKSRQHLSQVVFLDISTPKPGKFSLYEDMKQKLIKGGVPADEVDKSCEPAEDRSHYTPRESCP